MEEIGSDKQFADIFIDDIPLIDVRAPIEFCAGAFPGAVNLPLLNDEERHQIGLCYKTQGQTKAIELGHQLVSGKNKDLKMQAWKSFIKEHPNALIYCARGGMRSHIVQEWLGGQTLISGGYKSLRNFLLKTIDNLGTTEPYLVISGKTGSGKTILLKKMQARGQKVIDLEGLAAHRGSSFGNLLDCPQPSQINFENRLACKLLKNSKLTSSYTLVEDESATIGKCIIPKAIFQSYRKAPVFVLESSLESRCETILKEYVIEAWPFFAGREQAGSLFFDHFYKAMARIQKRLGGALFKECIQDLKHAIKAQLEDDSWDAHKSWIEKILVHYYDPYYQRNLDKNVQKIAARGDEKDLVSFLSRNNGGLAR